MRFKRFDLLQNHQKSHMSWKQMYVILFALTYNTTHVWCRVVLLSLI
jgi:hypothetical protein